MAAYYLVPSFRDICDRAGEVRQAGGILFAVISTIVASLVLPWIARAMTGQMEKTSAKEIFFRIGFFGLIGAIVDRLYFLLGIWLGTGASPDIVLKKVLFDQIIFSPLISIPYSVIAFLWLDEDLSLSRTATKLREGEFARRWPKTMGMCWGYWVPMLAAVYALPAPLQFPLFLFAQAAWSILLVHISKSEKPA